MTETRNNCQDVHDVTQLEMSLTHNILSVSRTPYLLDQFAISSEFKVNHEYIRSALIFLIPVEITKAKGKYLRPCHSFVEQIDVTFCVKIEEI